MDYKIDLLKDLQIVFGRFNGPLNKSNASAYFHEASIELAKFSSGRLLTDLRKAGLDANEEDAELVPEQISSMEEIRNSKRAVLVEKDIKFYKPQP